MSLDKTTIRDIRESLAKIDFKFVDKSSSFDSFYLKYLKQYGYLPLIKLEACCYYYGSVNFEREKIFLQYFRNDNPQGTVLICHGLFDHSGLYNKLTKCLLDSGFSVVIFDFPSHGLSSGSKNFVKSFDDYGKLIATILSVFEDLGESIDFAIGQSTGAAALSNFIYTQERNKFEKLVFYAPLLRTSGWRKIRLTYKLLHKHIHFVPRSFDASSNDQEFLNFLKDADKLQSKQIPVHWVGAMIEWEKQFQKLESYDVPLLILQGDADTTVGWKHNLIRFQDKFSHSKVKMIKGARHHLVNEADPWRSQLFEETLSFL